MSISAVTRAIYISPAMLSVFSFLTYSLAFVTVFHFPFESGYGENFETGFHIVYMGFNELLINGGLHLPKGWVDRCVPLCLILVYLLGAYQGQGEISRQLEFAFP